MTYSASGKLLLFGEYLVLRGAQALSVPLSVGQNLSVQPNSEEGILWRCFESDQCWLEIRFSSDLEILQTTDRDKALIIQKLLKTINEQQPALDLSKRYFKFDLDFNRQYGFGTSSTLTSLLSQWSAVDPYLLLSQSFGGSGYDIAASTANKPFLYSMEQRLIKNCTLPENITQNILFGYTGKKQSSSEEIADFKHKSTTADQIEEMNDIVKAAAQCSGITEWEKLMQRSEQLVSSVLGVSTIQEQYFDDYPFAIKSLGAWGGDFMMATCRNISTAKDYFRQKGNQPVFSYNELVKQ